MWCRGILVREGPVVRWVKYEGTSLPDSITCMGTVCGWNRTLWSKLKQPMKSSWAIEIEQPALSWSLEWILSVVIATTLGQPSQLASVNALQFPKSPFWRCLNFKMFRDTRRKLLHFAINRYLSIDNFSIHQGTSSIAVKLRSSPLMFTEILGKLLNREHPKRFKYSIDWRFMPVGRVSRFLQSLMSNCFSLLRFWIEEGSSTKLRISESCNLVMRVVNGWTQK